MLPEEIDRESISAQVGKGRGSFPQNARKLLGWVNFWIKKKLERCYWQGFDDINNTVMTPVDSNHKDITRLRFILKGM